jgi:dienelactone hydrolase
MKAIAIAAVALVGLLVSAITATAVDRCLQGASNLGDRRGLTSVAAAIEESCPCASYRGGTGGDRNAYRSCARDVLDSTLAGGELRRACRAFAVGQYTGATCGTRSIACGRFLPRSRHPVGCRIASPLSCDGGRLVEENICTNATHCSDVVEWTAGTCLDVRDQGPFGVGVREIRFTKPSAVNPANERVLDTVVWYPTTHGASPVDPQYRGVFDAPLEGSGGPYPLLLFSHGSCGYPLQSTFLLPQLASYGYVVVAPPHPGNTVFEYPACGTGPAQSASFVERPADVLFVLDQVLALSGSPGSPLAGAIDPDRIGMSGHSFGGLTTYLVQEREPRIKVALPFAPAVLFDPALTVPSLTVVGEIDSVVDNVATRAAWERSRSPRYWAAIGDAGHYAFSDGCFPSPDCSPPATRTQDEAHDAVRRFILPFLQVYLAGDERWEPFLAPGSAPSGTVLDVVR